MDLEENVTTSAGETTGDEFGQESAIETVDDDEVYESDDLGSETDGLDGGYVAGDTSGAMTEAKSSARQHSHSYVSFLCQRHLFLRRQAHHSLPQALLVEEKAMAIRLRGVMPAGRLQIPATASALEGKIC